MLSILQIGHVQLILKYKFLCNIKIEFYLLPITEILEQILLVMPSRKAG